MPREETTLQRAGDQIGAEPDERVQDDHQDDDVGLQELAGVGGHEADAGRRSHGLRDDQRKPGVGEREPQAEQDRRQRAGQDRAALLRQLLTELGAGMLEPGLPVVETELPESAAIAEKYAFSREW
jgi:hypothetical protein